MGKEIVNQFHEVQRVPYRINARRNMPRHILIKLSKIKCKDKNKGSEKMFEEIIVENFPNMGKEIVNQVQEAHTVPYRINPRRNTQDTH